jgi:hypothetical protein
MPTLRTTILAFALLTVATTNALPGTVQEPTKEDAIVPESTFPRVEAESPLLDEIADEAEGLEAKMAKKCPNKLGLRCLSIALGGCMLKKDAHPKFDFTTCMDAYQNQDFCAKEMYKHRFHFHSCMKQASAAGDCMAKCSLKATGSGINAAQHIIQDLAGGH